MGSIKVCNLKSIACFLFFLFISTSAISGEFKSVLYINAYHPGYKWSDSIYDGILDHLETKKVSLKVEYLDTKYIDSSDYYQKLSELFKKKYNKYQFDLILASDDNSYKFLSRYGKQLFGNTPVIYGGINSKTNYNSIIGNSSFSTGFYEYLDVKKSTDTILFIFPRVKRIFFIVDSSETGKSVEAQVSAFIMNYDGPIKHIVWKGKSKNQLLDSIEDLKSGDILYYTFYFKDLIGNTYLNKDIVKDVASISPVPVFTSWKFNLGYGVVGGHLLGGYEHGAAMAKIAIKFLFEGLNIKNISSDTRSLKGSYYFDDNALSKYGISKSSLPNESIIINNESYQKYFKALCIFLVILTSLTFTASIILYRKLKEERRKK